MTYKILFIMLIANSLNAQNTSIGFVSCNIELLDSIESNLQTLDKNIIWRYLNNMGYFCKNNVEFSEWNNEILYKILESEPAEVCNCISKLNREYKQFIFAEINEPNNDLINIDKIISKVQNIDCHRKTKKRILFELTKAKLKMHEG